MFFLFFCAILIFLAAVGIKYSFCYKQNATISEFLLFAVNLADDSDPVLQKDIGRE